METKQWGQIMTWLGNLVGTIGAWIGNVSSTMGTFIHGVLSGIGSWVGSVFSAIGTTIHNVFGAIGSFVGAVFSQIGTTIRGIWTGILGFLTGVWNVILAVAHVLFMLLVLYITWPFLIIWHFLGPHWNQILTFLTGIWNAIKKDRKSTRLNSSHQIISYAVFCLKKKMDRRLWISLSRWWPGWRACWMIVQPETGLRWHPSDGSTVVFKTLGEYVTWLIQPDIVIV